MHLRHIRGKEFFGYSGGLAQIVGKIRPKSFSVGFEDVADFVAPQIGAGFAFAYSEMDCRLFQSVRNHFPRADIVELDKYQRIDNRSAGNVAAGVCKNSFGNRQTAFSKRYAAAETPPLHRSFQHFTALRYIWKVEFEYVVSLNGVGVAPDYFALKIFEQLAFGFVRKVFYFEDFLAALARKPDGYDSVVFSGSRRKPLAAFADNLDIQLQTAHLLKGHSAEHSRLRARQELVFDI